MQPSKKLSLICFAVLTVLALAASVFGSLYADFSPMRGELPKADDSVVVWQLLYPDAEWGRAAAELLAGRLSSRVTDPLTIRPLAETSSDQPALVLGRPADAGTDPAVRADLLDRLGEHGYTITRQSNTVELTALTPEGMQAAIDALCADLDRLAVDTLAEADLREQTCIVRGEDTAGTDALLKTKLPLTFGEDGHFKILLASNLSAGQGESPSPYTITALGKMLEAEKPDLVLLCGGIANGFTTREALQTYLSELVAPLEAAGVPWAHLYAGADQLARTIKDSVFAEFAHCISGTGDYFLPILADGVPAFGIWMMSLPENGSVIYSPAQLADFTACAERLNAIHGGVIPAVMALASPLPEFVDAASTPASGEIGEAITIPADNCGLFYLATSAGVRGIYAGGNPLNSYTGTYNGIELGALAALGYDSYGFGGTFETNNRLRGARIVELDLNNLSSISSRMIYAADLGVER